MAEPQFVIDDDENDEFVFELKKGDVKKRYMTDDEIEYVLGEIRQSSCIPYMTARSIIETVKNPMRDELRKLQIFPKMIPELRKEVGENYQRSLIQSGDNIGVTAAQSFGQFYTQSTLNTFHTAGLAVKAVVTGVVRFEEILNASLKPKGVSCIIKFTKNNKSIDDIRKMVKGSIVYFNVKKIASSISYQTPMDFKPPSWYESFEMLHNNRFRNFSHCIVIKLNKKLLYEYFIQPSEIASCIESAYSDLACVFSPVHIGEIHIYVDTSSLNMPEEVLHYVTRENMFEVYMEDVVIPNIEKVYITGISDVGNAFFIQGKDDWHLETEGGDFGELLAHKDIDMPNTMTNNIWDIYNTLGVEAARQYIFEELVAIMPSISPHHSKFLVDYMTKTGTITSISRYTMRSEGSGALSKASFEETLDNLMNAGLFGETENPNSVSTSIICGKLGSFGSGVCELKVDVSKLGHLVNHTVKEK